MRHFARGSELRISFDSTHQVSKGTLPISANFDRDQVTISFEHPLKTIALGQ